MKVAFKASNGKYICAEQGGGLAYGNTVYKNGPYRNGAAPLYANRDSIGLWETFNVESQPEGVSIQCNNGMYWSAENDGGAGVSTNRTSVNAWEMFSLEGSVIKCHNGRNYVCAEIGSDCHVNGTRDGVGAWETFEIIDLDPQYKPNEDEIRMWKCNLTPDLGFNLQYGPHTPNGHTIFWTPSYVVYDDSTRERIRKAYRDLGFTHFPLNLTNHSTLYRDYYPNWDDTLINKYLEELLSAHLIPGGFCMGDEDTTVNCHADPSLVSWVVGRWEDAAPIKRPALDNDNYFWLVHQAFPNSRLYWHNPPYQGAPFVEYDEWNSPQDDPGINAKVWNYMIHDSFVQGFLFQGKAWENDANDSIEVLRSFVERLGHGVSGWPNPVDIVDYEETAYYLFNEGGNQEQALEWTKKIRDYWGSELKGYGNG